MRASQITELCRLNIYYLTMEKLQGFATEAKYNYAVSGLEIQSEYQEKRGNIYEEVEGLRITKRVGSAGDNLCRASCFWP
jgi:hypothetical protein